jgi:hypothetical protein
MDYTNTNAWGTASALAFTGVSVSGFLWLAIGLVALGGLVLCLTRMLPKSEDN